MKTKEITKMNFLDIENGVLTIRGTDPTRNLQARWERVTSEEEIAAFVERFPGELFASSSLDFADEYTTDPNVIDLCHSLRTIAPAWQPPNSTDLQASGQRQKPGCV